MHGRAIFNFAAGLLACCLTLGGCAKSPEPPVTSFTRQDITIKPVLEERPKSSYYYYLASRRHSASQEWSKALASIEKAILSDPASIYLNIERITLYLRLKDLDAALAAGEQLVNDHPDNVDCLQILAKLKNRAGKNEKTVHIYEQILNLDPKNKEAYLMLGDMHLEKGNIDQALELFTTMAEHFPDFYAVHFYLGKIFLHRNDMSRARKEFETTISLEPSLIEPRFELARIYMSRMDFPGTKAENEQVISLYKDILKIDRDNPRANLELALFYHKTGMAKKAQALFEKIGGSLDEDQRLLMSLNSDFIREDRDRDATIILTALLKSLPSDSKLHYLAGMVFESLSEYETAMSHYRQVKPDSLHYKKALVLIGFLFKEMGQTDRSIQWMEKQHRRFPEDVDIMTYLGFFYENQGQFDQALEILKKGLAQAPDNPALLFRLGVVQDKAGMKAACIDTMKKVIALEPDNANALNYLGYTYAELGIELENARELIEKAIRIKPEDGFIMDSLGWVYFKQGRYQKAVTRLEQAARLTEYDPVVVEHLGDAYARLQQYDKAIEAYRKAISHLKENVEEKTRQLNEKIKVIQTQRQTL